MRHRASFHIEETGAFKEQLLAWGEQFTEVLWLDSNGHQDAESSFDGMMAIHATDLFSQDARGAFEGLKEFRNTNRDWHFGYFTYDLKNDIENLDSENFDGLGFPEICFFRPGKIIQIRGNEVEFLYLESVASSMHADFNEIRNTPVFRLQDSGDASRGLRLHLRIFKDAYFSKVEKLRQHIRRGDIYEANFCQEFYSVNTHIDPLKTFINLNGRSKAPFTAFMKLGDHYAISASPERFLKKKGNKVIAQPMKGTARRSENPAEDLRLKELLGKDPKERAENIMIVDLVRNDLSRSALKGSVKVRELCGVYSFKQVHQMISTIEAGVGSDKDPVDIIKEAFPMGSMTGAPKLSAMTLIEELEASKRGLYSGAIGYFTPDGDFDFSVVIRSILYNKKKKYLSFSVGSAITFGSIAEKEYQECLLKARAMKEVLGNE